jgi:hypothetical protein
MGSRCSRNNDSVIDVEVVTHSMQSSGRSLSTVSIGTTINSSTVPASCIPSISGIDELKEQSQEAADEQGGRKNNNNAVLEFRSDVSCNLSQVSSLSRSSSGSDRSSLSESREDTSVIHTSITVEGGIIYLLRKIFDFLKLTFLKQIFQALHKKQQMMSLFPCRMSCRRLKLFRHCRPRNDRDHQVPRLRKPIQSKKSKRKKKTTSRF